MTPVPHDHDHLRRLLRAAAEPAVAPAGADADRSLVAAAVLVPVVFGPAPGILLTLRCAHLTAHGGQVSLPGGRIDTHDAGPEAAALREAHEEIGLDPARVEVIGRLRDHVTGTGYLVTPVVGLLPPGVALEALALRRAEAEVDAVFELPLSVLLDPEAPHRRAVTVAGRAREFWVWPHPHHDIWGATAAMLVDLATRLREAMCSA